MKKNRLVIFIIISFIFVSQVTAKKEPTHIFRSLYEWTLLNNTIHSWEGTSVDTLIINWGIPTREHKLANGNLQYEYILNENSTTTTTNSTSKYSDPFEATITSSVEFSTTDNKLTTITVIISNNIVSIINWKINYDNSYEKIGTLFSHLKKLCPNAAPNANINDENVLYLKSLWYKRWQEMTAEEILRLEKCSSIYGQNKTIKQKLYEDYMHSCSHNSKKRFEKYIELSYNTEYFRYEPRSYRWTPWPQEEKSIEDFIARILAYGDSYDVEQFKGFKDRFINSE